MRGRVGYALDCTLLYFTGGLAWGTMLNEATVGCIGRRLPTNPTVTGYVLGGGVEYKFWRDLSVKVEYQYVNLGKNNPVDTTVPLGAYAPTAAQFVTMRLTPFELASTGGRLGTMYLYL